jgi:hypothetical protein
VVAADIRNRSTRTTTPIFAIASARQTTLTSDPSRGNAVYSSALRLLRSTRNSDSTPSRIHPSRRCPRRTIRYRASAIITSSYTFIVTISDSNVRHSPGAESSAAMTTRRPTNIERALSKKNGLRSWTSRKREYTADGRGGIACRLMGTSEGRCWGRPELLMKGTRTASRSCSELHDSG